VCRGGEISPPLEEAREGRFTVLAPVCARLHCACGIFGEVQCVLLYLNPSSLNRLHPRPQA
jgi:hypothetical protein